MSPETVIYKLQRVLESQLQNLTNVITTGVDSMEKYRYILGQINALESVRQELSVPSFFSFELSRLESS